MRLYSGVSGFQGSSIQASYSHAVPDQAHEAVGEVMPPRILLFWQAVSFPPIGRPLDGWRCNSTSIPGFTRSDHQPSPLRLQIMLGQPVIRRINAI
eukprot:292160-Pelagomonas_calceolata.AAC.2